MGPQSFNCGNSELTRRDGRRMASMGPQSFNCGNTPTTPALRIASPMLQWGRSLSTAETGRFPRRERHVSRCELQWGRSLSTAETRRRAATCRPSTVLQWGRSLSTAETLPERLVADVSQMGLASMGPQSFNCGNSGIEVSATRLPVDCFNGAAVFQLRKHGSSRGDRPRRPQTASMGPQSFNCGNDPTGAP